MTVITTPEEALIFWKAVIPFTIASALGSAFIIVSILFFKMRRDLNARMIVYLSCADLCLSLLCLYECAARYAEGHLPDDASLASCKSQAVTTWYFMLSSVIWLALIALNSYFIICSEHKITFRQEIIANCVAWSVPLVILLIPLHSSLQWYGPRNGLWCSFSEAHRLHQIIVLLSFAGPAFITIVICYSLIFREIIKMKGKRRVMAPYDTIDVDTKTVKKMMLYVLAYLIVWMPLLACYIYEYIMDRYIAFWAEFLFDNMLHVQGLLNFILYGFNSEFTTNLIKTINQTNLLRFYLNISKSMEMKLITPKESPKLQV
jgi:hypothetical protein